MGFMQDLDVSGYDILCSRVGFFYVLEIWIGDS